MKYEVIEIKSGARMSHKPARLSSTTLFDSAGDAAEWIRGEGLSSTHEVRPVK